MDETPVQSGVQLGLLDLAVDLSVPEVYSGSEFTLYLHVKNPFSQPVWISSVELSLPTQLSAQRPESPLRKHSRDSRANAALMRSVIEERMQETRRLRQLLESQGFDGEAREEAESRLGKVEEQLRMDVASLTGGLIVDSSNVATLNVFQAKARTIYAKASNDSRISLFQPQTMD
jgi:hypothetical protein